MYDSITGSGRVLSWPVMTSVPNILDRAHTSSPTERIKASALLFWTTPGRIR